MYRLKKKLSSGLNWVNKQDLYKSVTSSKGVSVLDRFTLQLVRGLCSDGVNG